MTATEIIITSGATLVSGIIGGLIAIKAALMSVNRNEYYRIRELFKTALLEVCAKLSEDRGHPASLVSDNPVVDNLAISTIAISPCNIKKDLQEKWNKYRYDDKIEGMFPTEYTQKGPSTSKKIIEERIHDLIVLLNKKP